MLTNMFDNYRVFQWMKYRYRIIQNKPGIIKLI